MSGPRIDYLARSAFVFVLIVGGIALAEAFGLGWGIAASALVALAGARSL